MSYNRYLFDNLINSVGSFIGVGLFGIGYTQYMVTRDLDSCFMLAGSIAFFGSLVSSLISEPDKGLESKVE